MDRVSSAHILVWFSFVLHAGSVYSTWSFICINCTLHGQYCFCECRAWHSFPPSRFREVLILLAATVHDALKWNFYDNNYSAWCNHWRACAARVTVLDLCVCLCLSVCLSVCLPACLPVCVRLLLNISLLKWLFVPPTNSAVFWKCFVAELEHFCYSTATLGQPFFIPRKMRMCRKLDHMVWPFSLQRDVFVSYYCAVTIYAW